MMSEAAFEEVSVLSSIYCGEGEFRVVQQSAQDGLVVQINCSSGGDSRQNVSVMFHLHPSYPSRPPNISVSSTCFSRTQCHTIRQKLLDRAATLPPEPMLHQLVEDLQHCVKLTEDHRGVEEKMKESEEEEEWTEVLLLDHIRSRNRYVGLLEHWSQQLQLAGRLLLGQNILVILQGERRNIKSAGFRSEQLPVIIRADCCLPGAEHDSGLPTGAAVIEQLTGQELADPRSAPANFQQQHLSILISSCTDTQELTVGETAYQQ
ncbi:RWD domain-containing protein 3 isoform X2 [Kryptolebias marmoratus]|uniref:RWD domain-containing protein 3 isoform X2 n=1 Tax=Kryptolebias marmoratus TaxID=37003 RepID=UPI0007F91C11|nr:RWD domain-containing protein 3 isoform X2 [Kryptolebias marmoratus]